ACLLASLGAVDTVQDFVVLQHDRLDQAVGLDVIRNSARNPRPSPSPSKKALRTRSNPCPGESVPTRTLSFPRASLKSCHVPSFPTFFSAFSIRSQRNLYRNPTGVNVS